MLLKEKITNETVGGSLVLIKGAKQYNEQYGYRSLINKTLVEKDTIFRVASISKMIIGMAVLKLVEDKQLDLDKDIGTILGYKIRNPKYPNMPITTRMLMLHRSSITDAMDDEELGYNGVNGSHQFVSLFDLLSNQNSAVYTNKTYSNYPPGEKYSYSNFGAGILACIIEKCSNQLFTEYVKMCFFKPLAMDAYYKASHIKEKDKISDTFTGFTTNQTAQAFIEGTYPDFPLGNNFRGAAGGLFVSIYDLSKLMVVLMYDGMYQNVRILHKDIVDMFLNMNFFASRYHEEKQIALKGFSGGAYGISAVMYFSKAKQTGICFAANGGHYKSASTGLNHIQEEIINLLMSEL